MIGVVLWSNTDSQRAVFWCEDHGDLAVFEGNQIEKTHHPRFTAGDMVQFDIENRSRKRLARNPQLVAGDAFAGLVESLKASETSGVDAVRQTADILQFPTRPRSCAPAA